MNEKPLRFFPRPVPGKKSASRAAPSTPGLPTAEQQPDRLDARLPQGWKCRIHRPLAITCLSPGRGLAAASIARRIRLINFTSFFGTSSCCQIRNTRQPCRRNVRLTIRSRSRLPSNFCRQNARLLAGCVAWSGQPCQKQPSTNTASRAFRKTKSGLPNTGQCRRQPVMRWRRNKMIIANSVDLFPQDRTRDITSDLFDLPYMSTTETCFRTWKRRILV